MPRERKKRIMPGVMTSAIMKDDAAATINGITAEA